MKLGLYTSFMTIALNSASWGSPSQYTYVRALYREFDTSMHHCSNEYAEKFAHPNNKKYLEFLRTLYEKNNLKKATFSPKAPIPFKIHQILVGNRSVPESQEMLQKIWQLLHPGWEYTLWTDENVKTLQLKNKNLYDATDDPVEKTNILRYEILYQYGGVCVDVGTECIRSLEPLHYLYTFYTGIAPLACKGMLSTGIIAAAPGNLIIEECLRRLPSKAQEHERTKRNGSVFFSEVFCSVADVFPGTAIAFPPTYFSPTDSELMYTSSKDIKSESFTFYNWSLYAPELLGIHCRHQPHQNDAIHDESVSDLFDFFAYLFNEDSQDLDQASPSQEYEIEENNDSKKRHKNHMKKEPKWQRTVKKHYKKYQT